MCDSDEPTQSKFGYNNSYFPCFLYKPSASELNYFHNNIETFRLKFMKQIRNNAFSNLNNVAIWQLEGMSVAEFVIFLTKAYYIDGSIANHKFTFLGTIK